MEKYLVFRLYGPMAAWGEIAVGEVRRSASYPSRSAILGLVSAALGIRRDETGKLTALFNGYDVAVKVLSSGTFFTEFHTVSVPTGKMKAHICTRKDEIAEFNFQNKYMPSTTKPNPILSYRQYRCDSLSIVAIRSRKVVPYSLEVLKKHLNHPQFVLFLGRKSCPLALPLKPQIIEAEGFRGALDGAVFPPLVTDFSGEDVTDRFIELTGYHYYWEGEAGDMTPQMTRERYDEPLNRQRWQFASRKEYSMIAGEES